MAAHADFLGALELARKRKIGPFAPVAEAASSHQWNSAASKQHQSAIAKLVRAGYSFETAKRVLTTAPAVAAAFFRRLN